MPLTIAELGRGTMGNKRTCLATVTFDSSYPTGGLALAPGQLGMSQIDMLIVDQPGRTLRYNKTTSKLEAYQQPAAAAAGAHTEVPNTTNLSTLSATILAIGS